MKPVIFTLTGPSCAGKSTLERMMVGQLGFENLVSTTTRNKRFGEEDGVNYSFRTVEQFEAMKLNNELIEFVAFNDNQYGLTEAEVNRVTAMGKCIVAVVEPDGREQIKAYAEKVGAIFVPIFVTSSETTIASRFLKRLILDIADGEDGNDAANFVKFMNTHTTRLAGMLTTERAWISEALSEFNPYSYIFFQFDENTQLHVLEKIRAMAKEHMYTAKEYA